MIKIFIFVIWVFVGFSNVAFGENILTTQSFVDSAVAQKQDKIPANNGTEQILMNTGTPGEIGTKNIYDSTGSYVEQTDALITAGDFNTAVQTAIDNEFECIQYNANNECLLMRLIGAETLPSGYTALKYIESTGTQYLDLGQPIGSGENLIVKFEYTTNTKGVWFGARDGNDYKSAGFTFDFAEPDATRLDIIPRNISGDLGSGYYVKEPLALNTPYILNWYGSSFKTPILIPSQKFLNTRVTETNYLYTPASNAYLFAYTKVNDLAGVMPMRIYYFRVEGKMDLVPARRDSDGVIGMYDVVNGTFLTNAGLGTFIAGPEIYMPQGN